MKKEESELKEGDGNVLPLLGKMPGSGTCTHCRLSLLSVNSVLLSKVRDATSLSLLDLSYIPIN